MWRISASYRPPIAPHSLSLMSRAPQLYSFEFWHTLVESTFGANSLRYSFGGWYGRWASIRLMNEKYGPSESSMNSMVWSMTCGVFESAPSPLARYSWATLPRLTNLSATFRSDSLSFIVFHAFAIGPERKSPGITSKKLSWSSNPSVRCVYGVIHALEE